MISAGVRNAAVIAWACQRPRSASCGAPATGGSAVMLWLLTSYFLNAAAAAFSSLEAVPSTSEGFLRKSWRIFHSPCAGVPPNAAGWVSDMSKRKILACASAVAVARVTASEYAPSMTIAAFGFFAKTLLTDVGKSVWSAPEAPPTMLPVSLKIDDIALSAFFTDGSVHLILCSASWSYFLAPAWRR